MKITRITFLVISHSISLFFILSTFSSSGRGANTELKAVNDTFYFVTNCVSDLFFDDVLKNDDFQGAEGIQICSVYAPNDGILTFGSNGRFTLTLPTDYTGIVEFNYSLCNRKNGSESSVARVVIIVQNDNDCDGIVNSLDLDNDNDGIPDIDEGNGTIDSDGDGIPDNFDIDADNDGITDNVEWQKEGEYLKPFESDTNKNGWDDAYDLEYNGRYYKPVDTNGNGIPDFIDNDSDGDGVNDNLEAFDMDNDGFSDIVKIFIDDDNDGLDDAFDLISCWSLGCNAIGSNSPLPDLDKNGIRDWRDNKIKVGNYSRASAIDVLVYPNPSNGRFYVNMPPVDKNENIDLQIINFQGIIIRHETITSGISQINLENIAGGNYILKVNSATFNQQFVIAIN